MRGMNSTSGEAKNREPIAIVGLGCRFPGADGPTAYWELLCSGKDAMRDVPKERWDSSRFAAKDPDRTAKAYVQRGGFLDSDPTEFDAAFFGISAREACYVDPQQRIMMEVAWEALEDAGLNATRLCGSATGVYVGAFTMDHTILSLNPLNRETIDTHSATGGSMTMLSNRLSYYFDFRGPSMTVDTACSGSLVAVHLACQAIWNDECDLALAGGVNVMMRPEYFIIMSKGRFLSPDGQCRSFDAAANGYARGEGAGVVVLKPLSAALRDGNPIYALIRGTGINQDGRTDGITVPNPDAQEALIRGVATRYHVPLGDVRYVEAHGTGTIVGDPIEAEVLGRTVGAAQRNGDVCLIGSAKAAIGHLEAAAGVAGLIKAALCAQRGKVPPQAGLRTPNPHIPFDSLKLKLTRQLEPLPDADGPVYLGVNAFGYGGTNAHVLLERYRPPSESRERTATDEGHPQVLVLSAKSRKALRAVAQVYSAFLQRPDAPPLRDICSSAFQCRTHLNHRLAAVADSRDGMATELAAFGERERSEHVVVGKPLAPPEPRPVFVFSGMGPQWWGMGHELYESYPVFRDTARTIDAVFQRLAGYSLLTEMLAPKERSKMERTEIAQSANFLLQISLFELLRSWGVRPAAIVGHSVGEVSAAYASGALELDDAVGVSFHRGRIQAMAAGKGAMLAVGLGGEEVLAMANGYRQAISIAALNGPGATTLSGDRDALEAIAAELEHRGLFHRMLRVEVPYHSHHMDPLKDPLRTALAGLRPNVPHTPLFSTVTGARLLDETLLDGEYWCRNMRDPVLFAQTISSILAAGHHCFLEIGPHPVLSHSIEELVRASGTEGRVAACLRRETPERQTLLEAMGTLHTAGCDLAPKAVFGASGPHVKLPHYPWQRELHWTESAANARDRLGTVALPLLGMQIAGPAVEYECDLELECLDYLQDHVVDGLQVFPGAGYVEQGLALHWVLEPDAAGVTLEDIEFKRALILSAKRRPKVRVRLDDVSREYGVYSLPQDGSTEWTLHATGRISSAARTSRTRVPLEALRERLDMHAVSPEAAYAKLAKAGLRYGPAFQGIEALWRREGVALAALKSPPRSAEGEPAYRLHPSLLDAAIQTTALALKSNQVGDSPFLPVGVKRISVWGDADAHERIWSYCEISAQTATEFESNIVLCDESGLAFAQVTGLRCQALPVSAAKAADLVRERTYRVQWERENQVVQRQNLGPWLLVGGAGGFAHALSEELRALGAGTTCELSAYEGSRLDSIPEQGGGWGGIVFLGALEAWTDGETLPPTEATAQLLALTQALVSADGRERRPRLYVVTDGAQQVQAESLPGLMQAPVVGLGRVIQAEHPELQCTLVDIDRANHADAARHLADELAAGGKDMEIALRGSSRYVSRIAAGASHQIDDTDAATPAKTGDAFRLEVRAPGRLEQLRFESFERRKPGPREIVVEVRATALNFKDVLKALGMLPAKAMQGSYSSTHLGLEAAGVVVELGEAVTEYSLGDELVVAATDSFASHLVLPVDSMFAAAKPANLSFAEAASLPVIFMTAYYALHEVARLRKGETVLIHAAAGGVGLAAIQVAQWLGAKVLATAGRDSKREYVRSLGVEHVLHSRDMDFVDQVMALTDHKGVDVVLNSIGGETLLQSLSLLAPLGRFIEIGKRDIVDNKKLPLLPFHRNLSFTAFDLDRIMAEHPALLKRLFGEVWERFRSGDFRPTRLEVFPAAQTEKAFRHMAQSNHTGKVVISFEDITGLSLHRAPREAVLREDATYLVTGAFGGFGRNVARWMGQAGARHLVLVGRSGAASAEAQATLEALRAQGVDVKVAAIDIAHEASVAALLREIRETLPPLRGVLHAAAVLDDALLVHLDRDKLERVIAPKARGAWLLHRETLGLPLEFFVMFSSIASLVGNVGQGNYVAANAFLDALALERRAMGLPAVSINWGPLAEVGMAARDPHVLEHLERVGMKALSPHDAIQGLISALRGDAPQFAFLDVDWSRWSQMNRSLADSPKFSGLVSQGAERDDEPAKVRAMLLETDPTARPERLARLLAEVAAETLRTTGDNVDIRRPLTEIGVDSLMAVELQMSIQAKLGVEFPILELTKKGNLVAFAQDMLVRMNVPATPTPTPTPAPRPVVRSAAESRVES